MEINHPELSGSAGTASLLPPDSLLTLQPLLCRCCRAKLWQSSTRESSKSEWDKPERMRIRLPEETSPYMGTARTRAWTVRPGCWGQTPTRWKMLVWKQRAFRKRRQYFCLAQAIWPLLFVCFCYYKYCAVCTHRPDCVILKINFFMAILVPKCIPSLFLLPTCSCTVVS